MSTYQWRVRFRSLEFDEEAHGAVFTNQKIPLLLDEDVLRHWISTRLRQGTREQIPHIVATADRLLASISPYQLDFDVTEAAVLEVTCA